MADAQSLKVGGRYNWRNQPERLIYLGMCEPRNGRWHQFALVEKPGEVWCEVHPSDLPRVEETADGVQPSRGQSTVRDHLHWLHHYLKLSPVSFNEWAHHYDAVQAALGVRANSEACSKAEPKE